MILQGEASLGKFITALGTCLPLGLCWFERNAPSSGSFRYGGQGS